MNMRIFFKSFFLMIALSATLYAVTLLNTGHMNDFWISLGLGKANQSLNWCRERVVKISGTNDAGTWTLFEEKQEWLIGKNSDPVQKLDYLEVEKWFAKNCIINIEIYKNISILDMAILPFGVAHFNDGTNAKIISLGNEGVYQINEVIFKSKDWTQALEDLKNLLKI